MSTSTPVQSLADSAGQCGLSSSSPPAETAVSCPFTSTEQTSSSASSAPSSTVYEYCDLSNLIVEWGNGTNTYSVTLDKQRRKEQVITTTFEAYKKPLGSHELVIEALADYRNETQDKAGPKLSENVKPLNLRVGGVNSSHHTSFQPAHPHAVIAGNGVNVETHGGAPASTRILLDEWGVLGGSTAFGRFWPFGGKREYSLSAKSCGSPNGQPAIKDLRVHMVVFPYEEWKITFGLGPRYAGSAELARNHAKRTGPGDAHSARVLTIKKTVRDTETTSERSRVGKDDYAESYKIKVAETKVLTANTREITEEDNTWKAKPDLKDESGSELRKISVERSVGGRKSELDVTENINRIMKFEETVKDVKNILSSIKLGWSISASYSLLGGKIAFGWGYRYPEAYREEHRVYYVERVISVDGTCTFLEGKVEGMFGLEVDPWWAPVTVVAKIYVSIGLKIELTAGAKIAYTNWATINNKSAGGDSIDLTFGTELSAELGAKAGGRAMGYGVEAKLALEGKMSLEVKGKLCFTSEPSMIANIKSDGIKLVGEILTIGKTTDRYAFEPMVLVEPKEYVKDKKIW